MGVRNSWEDVYEVAQVNPKPEQRPDFARPRPPAPETTETDGEEYEEGVWEYTEEEYEVTESWSPTARVQYIEHHPVYSNPEYWIKSSASFSDDTKYELSSYLELAKETDLDESLARAQTYEMWINDSRDRMNQEATMIAKLQKKTEAQEKELAAANTVIENWNEMAPAWEAEMMRLKEADWEAYIRAYDTYVAEQQKAQDAKTFYDEKKVIYEQCTTALSKHSEALNNTVIEMAEMQYEYEAALNAAARTADAEHDGYWYALRPEVQEQVLQAQRGSYTVGNEDYLANTGWDEEKIQEIYQKVTALTNAMWYQNPEFQHSRGGMGAAADMLLTPEQKEEQAKRILEVYDANGDLTITQADVDYMEQKSEELYRLYNDVGVAVAGHNPQEDWGKITASGFERYKNMEPQAALEQLRKDWEQVDQTAAELKDLLYYQETGATLTGLEQIVEDPNFQNYYEKGWQNLSAPWGGVSQFAVPKELAYCTPREQQTYVALHGKDPEFAKQYMETLMLAYNYRSGTDREKRSTAYYSDRPVEAGIHHFLGSFIKPVMGAVAMYEDLSGRFSGEYKPNDPYSPANAYYNQQEIKKQSVHDNTDPNFRWLADGALNIAEGAAQFPVALIPGVGPTAAVLGNASGSAGEARYQAIQRGASPEQAGNALWGNFVFDAALGILPVDNLAKTAGGGGKSVLGAVGKQAALEAVEGGVSTAVGTALDNAIMGDKSYEALRLQELMAQGMSEAQAGKQVEYERNLSLLQSAVMGGTTGALTGAGAYGWGKRKTGAADPSAPGVGKRPGYAPDTSGVGKQPRYAPDLTPETPDLPQPKTYTPEELMWYKLFGYGEADIPRTPKVMTEKEIAEQNRTDNLLKIPEGKEDPLVRQQREEAEKSNAQNQATPELTAGQDGGIMEKTEGALEKIDWDAVVSKKGETRIDHVNRHKHPNPNRSVHGVFTGEPKTMIEIAWDRRDGVVPIDDGVGGQIYNIPYPDAGYESGTTSTGEPMHFITIIVKSGTSEIITAFPSSGNYN